VRQHEEQQNYVKPLPKRPLGLHLQHQQRYKSPHSSLHQQQQKTQRHQWHLVKQSWHAAAPLHALLLSLPVELQLQQQRQQYRW
jgi:hypothetical protein